MMVVRQGLSVVLIGTAIGSAGALIGGRWVVPLLFAESPRDPVIFGVVTAALAIVAIVAAAIPARPAALVDPVVALRAE